MLNFNKKSAVDEASAALAEFKRRLAQPLVFIRTAPICKGLKTLCKLGFTNQNITEHLLALEPTDYVQGPSPAADGFTPAWVFGKTIYTAEICFEFCLGPAGNPYACLSYCVAERPMTYPLRPTPTKRKP